MKQALTALLFTCIFGIGCREKQIEPDNSVNTINGNNSLIVNGNGNVVDTTLKDTLKYLKTLNHNSNGTK